MFGGVGLYCRGAFFGIIAGDVLSLKWDHATSGVSWSVVGCRFGCRRDLLRAGRLENLFRAIGPFRIVAMHGAENVALAQAAFVALGFDLRYARAHKRADQSAGCAARANP